MQFIASFSSKRFCRLFTLFVCVCAGLVCGVSYTSATSVVSLMPAAVSGRLSIVSYIPLVLLPFLFAYFSAYCNRFQYIYPLCFFEMFLFGCAGHAVSCWYGASAWLWRILLMFSDYLVLPIWLFLCIRLLSDRLIHSRRIFYLGLIGSTCIWLVDYFFISPFLALM